MNVDCTSFMYVMSKSEDKEGNVRGLASFIDVESANVRVVVDVM